MFTKEFLAKYAGVMSEEMRRVFVAAIQAAKDNGRTYVRSEHLLLGLLAIDGGAAGVCLAREGVSVERVWQVLGRERESASAMRDLRVNPSVVNTFDIAYGGNGVVGSEHMLKALLRDQDSRAVEVLRVLGVDFDRLMQNLDAAIRYAGSGSRAGGLAQERPRVQMQVVINHILPADYFDEADEFDGGDGEAAGDGPLPEAMGVPGMSGMLGMPEPIRRMMGEMGLVPEPVRPKTGPQQPKVDPAKQKAAGILARLGTNLTERARNGELGAVIGREAETDRVITILSRKTKSNPVLVGEPGVGKTAVAELLAQRIAKGHVPSSLKNRQIYQIDMGGLVAGTRYRGDFEEKVQQLVAATQVLGNVILFIDELHMIAGAGSAEGTALDAANMFKPELASGRLKLIGATTFDEYRKYIEKDKALARRLQPVTVNEASAAETLEILRGIAAEYSEFHGVKIAPEALEDIVRLSSKYLPERVLPDKAIDILDEAAANAKLRAQKISGQKASLSEADVAKAISSKTGIPVGQVQKSETKMLLNLEKSLGELVVGQEEAVAKVAAAIRLGRSGLTSGNRPIGSFIFMGPTGVGKTELARVVAREVFGSEGALIKVDMSEFAEKHTVSGLIGTTPGYVGFENGGKLTEAVRKRPGSVVLFDEIEKAHPDVANVLLQILEDGALTDGHGNKVKFNNTIVILTSNLGTEAMRKESELGFSVDGKVSKGDARSFKALEAEHLANEAAAQKALAKFMKPELINRFDATVVFKALTKDGIGAIFENLLAEFTGRLDGRKLTVRQSAKNYLIEKGFDPKNGARALRRVLESELGALIAGVIIDGTFPKGAEGVVVLAGGVLKLEIDEKRERAAGKKAK